MNTNSMQNSTLALTFKKFIKVGRNSGGRCAKKLFEMIINQLVAILVPDSDHFAEKCFTYLSRSKYRSIFLCVGYQVGIFPYKI